MHLGGQPLGGLPRCRRGSRRPGRTARRRSIRPTISPSTRTLASLTRCTTARTPAHACRTRSAAAEETLALLLRVEAGADDGGRGAGAVPAAGCRRMPNPRLDSSRSSIAVSAWSRATIGAGPESTGAASAGAAPRRAPGRPRPPAGATGASRLSSVSMLAAWAALLTSSWAGTSSSAAASSMASSAASWASSCSASACATAARSISACSAASCSGLLGSELRGHLGGVLGPGSPLGLGLEPPGGCCSSAACCAAACGRVPAALLGARRSEPPRRRRSPRRRRPRAWSSARRGSPPAIRSASARTAAASASRARRSASTASSRSACLRAFRSSA